MERTHKGFLWTQIDGEGRRLQICLASTVFFGLLAHGYGLLNLLIGHDSLYEFYWAVSRDWKITLGRFMEPVLRYLMGEMVVLPWLTGLAGIFFVGLAVHLLSKLFSLNTVWENLALSGVCVTNITVTAALATYLHDFAGDMLALLLAVCAAWCWHRMREGFSLKYTILGGVCLGASLGFYQAYLAVQATVLVIYGIRELLTGRDAKGVCLHLLRVLPILVLGVAGYFGGVFVTRLLFAVTETSGDPVNDLSMVGGNLMQIVSLTGKGYRQVLQDLFVNHWDSVKGVTSKAGALVGLVNILLLVHSLWMLVSAMKRKAIRGWEAGLMVLLLALLPLTMSCVSIVSTAFHNLVRYAYYLYYLLILVITRGEKPGKWQNWLVLGAIAFVLMNNIQVSNTAYIKKDLEQQATLSSMTRILNRLETYDDYVYGESEVAFTGSVADLQHPLAVGTVPGVIGLYNKSPITSPDAMQAYFDIVLQYPIRICDEGKLTGIRQTEAYQAMPAFPAQGCVATIDDVIVVKIS